MLVLSQLKRVMHGWLWVAHKQSNKRRFLIIGACSLDALYRQVDLPIDCGACRDEASTGLVSPGGYCI